MADGKSAFACNLRKPDPAMHVLVKKFRRSPLLPWRQTSLGTPSCCVDYAVSLEKMRAEDEAELIESQHRETVAPPKERKDAFGDLSHDQIVYEDCQAIVTHPAKTEILSNVI